MIGSRSHCGRGDNGAAGPAVFPANGIDRRSVEGASSASLSAPAKCSSNSAWRLAGAEPPCALIVTYLTRADDAASSSKSLPAAAAVVAVAARPPYRSHRHTTAAAPASAYRKHPVIQLSSVGRK